jgi:hypothetical protein
MGETQKNDQVRLLQSQNDLVSYRPAIAREVIFLRLLNVVVHVILDDAIP